MASSMERRECVAGSALLQQAAQLVDLAQVSDVQLGHEVAASWPIGDLPLLFEDAQRLAYRRDTESDLRRDILLVDALPGA